MPLPQAGEEPGLEEESPAFGATVEEPYVSPRGVRFYARSLQQPEGYYAPSPADDLYALGVTAYRLVMGQYPADVEARKDEQGQWQAMTPDVRPVLESNPRVEPLLREVIVRLLSDAHEERGTARQVAEVLEAAAGGAEDPERFRPPERARAWKPWLAVAAAGACAVLLWHWQPVRPWLSSHAPDEGTVAVGDTSATGSQAATPPSTEKPLTQEPLPEPRPGQTRPDKRGRCPGSKQVPINGACWLEQLPMSAEECVQNGSEFFKGKCYDPAHPSPKKPQPTSSPPEAR